MENEFRVLSNIEKNKNATQREIARNTGLSLGNVNILIQRLIQKGLVITEKLNSKTIRYTLTPSGLKEKAEITYGNIVSSYKHISEINSKIDGLLSAHLKEKSLSLTLFGDNDEIYHIVASKLKSLRIDYYFFQDFEDLKIGSELNGHREGGGEGSNLYILVWHPNYEELLNQNNIRHINLLDHLDQTITQSIVQ
jgi:DNA-binding MarR family transcriptional regulator